jgi:sugar-specific transcriptional regulator TrmB
MTAVDLTPFGFTPTESRAYAALLELGPSSGYEIAQRTRVARANAYAALEGLVQGGAAARAAERPRRYRATDPTTLLARLAARQGEALERLGSALEGAMLPRDAETSEVRGLRATANVISQIVARAERAVEGVVAAALWPPTLPAWRRAATRARLAVRIAGAAAGTEGLIAGTVAPDVPTLLLVDDVHTIVADMADGEVAALWSSHPLIAGVARRALASGR